MVKEQSKEDKRVFYLDITEKFEKYYKFKNEYIYTVINRAKEEFTEDEVHQLENMLHRMSTEMMPEVSGFFNED